MLDYNTSSVMHNKTVVYISCKHLIVVGFTARLTLHAMALLAFISYNIIFQQSQSCCSWCLCNSVFSNLVSCQPRQRSWASRSPPDPQKAVFMCAAYQVETDSLCVYVSVQASSSSSPGLVQTSDNLLLSTVLTPLEDAMKTYLMLQPVAHL